MPGIFWLVSYPKSGNTWLRALLTNYWHNGDQPVSINALGAQQIGVDRQSFDEWLGIESSDLTLPEIERYRPRVYERLAAASREPLFIKVHDAWSVNSAGRALFPPAATAGTVYIVRNPLDVAVSYAHHEHAPIDTIIRQMRNECNGLAVNRRRLYPQVPQRLGTWSSHATGWIDQSGLPVHCVRYEDLLRDPEAIFKGILHYVEMTIQEERVRRAIEFSRFERLQAQEAVVGFAERQPTADSFFRQGRAGAWQEVLTATQVQQIVADHGPTMHRFGYLDAASVPIF